MLQEIKNFINLHLKRMELLFGQEVEENGGFAKPRIVILYKEERLLSSPSSHHTDLLHVKKEENYILSGGKCVHHILNKKDALRQVKLKSFVEDECKIMKEHGKEIVCVFFFGVVQISEFVFDENQSDMAFNTSIIQNKVSSILALVDLPAERITSASRIIASGKKASDIKVDTSVLIGPKISVEHIARLYPMSDEYLPRQMITNKYPFGLS